MANEQNYKKINILSNYIISPGSSNDNRNSIPFESYFMDSSSVGSPDLEYTGEEYLVDEPNLDVVSPTNDASIEEKLIEAVRRREFLWNMSSKEYKIHKNKLSSWAEVAIEVGANSTPEIVKKKWTNIRSCYQKSKAKLPSGSGAKGVKDYKYHRLLTFLDDIFERKPTISSHELLSSSGSEELIESQAKKRKLGSLANERSTILKLIETNLEPISRSQETAVEKTTVDPFALYVSRLLTPLSVEDREDTELEIITLIRNKKKIHK